MNGTAFAWFCRMRLGMEYVHMGAAYTAAEVIAQFNNDPDARAAMEEIGRERFEKFWNDTLARFRLFIEREERKEKS